MSEQNNEKKKKEYTKEEKIFSANLQEARENQKLTQAELAEKTKLSTTIISEYETMKKQPKIYTVLKLANALGVSIDMLCGNTPLNQFQKKLENSCIYALSTVLKQLKPQVNVSDNIITLTISSDNDSPEYSSHEIVKFFEEYEIIQNFANSTAKDDMVKTLMENLENKYNHLPGFPAYEKISNAQQDSDSENSSSQL